MKTLEESKAIEVRQLEQCVAIEMKLFDQI